MMDNTNFTFSCFYRHKKLIDWPELSSGVVTRDYTLDLENIKFEFWTEMEYQYVSPKLGGLEINFYSVFHNYYLTELTAPITNRKNITNRRNYSKIYFYLKETASFFNLVEITVAASINKPFYHNTIKLQAVPKLKQRLLFRRYRSLLLLEAL